jgi:hypothetical protein
MITQQKLAIYTRFDGDVDAWQRADMPERHVMEDGGANWHDIGSLVQELTMLKRKLVSAEYAERIRMKLSRMTADQKVAEAMMELA